MLDGPVTTYAVQYEPVPPGTDPSYVAAFKEKVIQSEVYYEAGKKVEAEFHRIKNKDGAFMQEGFYPDGTLKIYADNNKIVTFYPSGAENQTTKSKKGSFLRRLIGGRE